MFSVSWEVTGHQKKTGTAAENTGSQPAEMGGKGWLVIPGRSGALF